MTSLGTALVADDEASVADAVASHGWGQGVVAGTVDDHVGRFRLLAEAGVGTAFVALPDAHEPTDLERFGRVITAFR